MEPNASFNADNKFGKFLSYRLPCVQDCLGNSDAMTMRGALVTCTQHDSNV